jgi:hypothetical protein
MTHDITTSTGGLLMEVPELSEPLRRCLARTETIARYSTDAAPGPDGAEFHAGNWIAPKWVSQSLADEAARLLPLYERALTPVPDQTFQRWLNVLWVGLPKAAGSSERWEAVKLVYAALLDDFPVACFTKRTLRAARDRFRFFPGTTDLASFLGPYRVEAENAVSRLRVVAHTTTRRPTFEEAPPPKTEEDIRAVGEICDQIRAQLRNKP